MAQYLLALASCQYLNLLPQNVCTLQRVCERTWQLAAEAKIEALVAN